MRAKNEKHEISLAIFPGAGGAGSVRAQVGDDKQWGAMKVVGRSALALLE